jgi:4-hydroxy-3-polyprenylbenzoate decarboxylase
MAYENLAGFIAELEDDGDLVRIGAEVDPHLEIAEITDRVCKSATGGPVLVFENVKGHSIPVVSNLLGSERRMCKAFGAQSFDSVAERITGLIEPDLPAGWLDSLKLVPQLAQMSKLPPKSVKTGLCQQVVSMGREVNLAELPIPKSWPDESGPTITAGQLFVKDAESGIRHVGRYPLEVRDRNSLRVHWTAHQRGMEIFAGYRQAGRPMPVAIAFGGDPVYTYMADVTLPPNTDDCLFGGFLRGEPMELVKCRSIDMEIPAEAEIVLEGMIDPNLPLEQTGRIGQATGFYDLTDDVPIITVSALTRRSNPMFPAMIVGPPPTEDYWLNRATERIFLPLVRLCIPELIDLHLPRSGAFRNLAFVSIRKRYPQQARKVMNALWSLGRLMIMKMIVVVDEDVDVHNEEQVWYTAGSNVHPGRDVVFCEGPTHMTDHAAPVRGMGHKLGLDATRKLPEEGHPRQWPAPLEMTDQIKQRITERWSEYGLME